MKELELAAKAALKSELLNQTLADLEKDPDRKTDTVKSQMFFALNTSIKNILKTIPKSITSEYLDGLKCNNKHFMCTLHPEQDNLKACKDFNTQISTLLEDVVEHADRFEKFATDFSNNRLKKPATTAISNNETSGLTTTGMLSRTL